MKRLLLILTLLLPPSVHAFVLLNPFFSLKNADQTKVQVSSEGCVANGISDAVVASAIKEAVEFWNDVPESSLKLSYGGKSSASISNASLPSNVIIVGCGALASPQILGVTQNDYTHRSARITMNNAVYTGSYNEASFIGTLIHEVGHGLGLNHSKDPASVMTYSPHGWTDRPKYISQDDIDGVVYLYPNEKTAAGLLGSCSSFAGDGERSTSFSIDFLVGFALLLLLMKFWKAARR